MQSAEDRRRLLGRYGEGPSSPLVAVLKCAAGIVTLFAVAAGPWVILSAADGGGTATEQPAYKAAAAYPNSMEESRRVFEERRRQSQGEKETTKSALAK